jgi:hypothetical protein
MLESQTESAGVAIVDRWGAKRFRRNRDTADASVRRPYPKQGEGESVVIKLLKTGRSAGELGLRGSWRVAKIVIN